MCTLLLGHLLMLTSVREIRGGFNLRYSQNQELSSAFASKPTKLDGLRHEYWREKVAA